MAGDEMAAVRSCLYRGRYGGNLEAVCSQAKQRGWKSTLIFHPQGSVLRPELQIFSGPDLWKLLLLTAKSVCNSNNAALSYDLILEKVSTLLCMTENCVEPDIWCFLSEISPLKFWVAAFGKPGKWDEVALVIRKALMTLTCITLKNQM